MRSPGRSRIGAMLLALVVGLTLTLVCQGHKHGDVHVGPHLTVLGEPGHGQGSHGSTLQSASLSLTGPDSGVSSGTDMSMPDMPGMDMSGSGQLDYLLAASADASTTGATQPDSTGPNIASAVTSPPLEPVSISTLSFMFLLLLLRRNSELRALETGVTTARRSQTTIILEPPPPR